MPAKSSGTSKPYLHFIGGNAASVTGSCTIVRFDNIKLAVDMGLIQTNNLVADYNAVYCLWLDFLHLVTISAIISY